MRFPTPCIENRIGAGHVASPHFLNLSSCYVYRLSCDFLMLFIALIEQLSHSATGAAAMEAAATAKR